MLDAGVEEAILDTAPVPRNAETGALIAGSIVDPVLMGFAGDDRD